MNKYQLYLDSFKWKNKRKNLIYYKDICCYCCGVEKWKYIIYRCKNCGNIFYSDRWDYIPYCDNDCNTGFDIISNGSRYFQLHHINYKNFGNEYNDDLIIVCEDCHNKIHLLIKLYKNYFDIKTAPEYLKRGNKLWAEIKLTKQNG